MDYVPTLPAILRNVKYDLAGGNGTANPVKVEVGKKVTPKPADPTRTDGKVFKGWKIQGESTMWNFDTSVMPDRDITLVAQYA